MYKFNNDNIITGYIKQLLHSFNLPICNVFDNEQDFLDAYPQYEGNYPTVFGIIKKYKNNQDCIVCIEDNEVKLVSYYLYNRSYRNLTTNFSLFNGLYDTQCHTYLGNYLRFIRDYSNVNLMCLYNCFANEILVDKIYKYLIIPVKHNKDYTVAFNGVGYSYLFTYKSKLEDIQEEFENKATPTKSSRFLKPFKINSGIGDNTIIDSGPRTGKVKYACFMEPDYKLVIRIGLNDNDVITVLEGDYTQTKQHFTPVQANYDKDLEDKNYSNVDVDNFVSDLQLLDYHLGQNNINYPFADKLVEYLTDMVITPNDKISKNIIDAKYKVYERYGNRKRSTLGVLNGSFTNIDRLRFLDAYSQTKYEYKKNYDLLGYVDKDIEQCLDDESRDSGGVE